MKKLLSLLTMFLFITLFSINVQAESGNKIITEDDLEMDLMYEIKAGDIIKFTDDLPFDLTINYTDLNTPSDEYPTINQYVANKDFLVEIKNFSIEDRYIVFNEVYKVTFNLKGKGENFVKQSKLYRNTTNPEVAGSYAFMPDNPTYDGYKFCGWFNDEECNNAVIWDSQGETKINGDTTLYAKWEQIYLDTIRISGDAYVNPGDEITIQIIPYYGNGRVYDGEDLIIGLKENSVDKTDIIYNTTNRGYFYTYTVPNNECENTLYFYIKNTTPVIDDTFIVKAYNANPEDILINDGWPYGTNFTNNKDGNNTVTLNIKTIDDLDNVTYQWQSGNTANGVFTNIETKTSSSLDLNQTNAQKWYRCLITFKKNNNNYTVISKAVKLLDSEIIKTDGLYSTSDASHVDGFLQGLYISNGYGAYCLGDPSVGQNHIISTNPFTIEQDTHTKAHFFSILGIYNDGIKDHWTTSSFDEAWSIYMKDSTTDSFIGTDNIKSIICRFNDYDSNDVLMNVEFNNSCDAAIYTDTCIGKFPDIYYADCAAVKAIIEDGQYKGIDIITRKNFSNANLEDACGFTLRTITPTDYFDIDARFNGNKVYSGNDYTNECTYEELLNYFKENIFDYNYGLDPAFNNGNNPFIINTYKGKDVVIGMFSKDGVLATSFKNTDSLKIKMAIGNANKIGINNIDPIAKAKPSNNHYVPPMTGINK